MVEPKIERAETLGDALSAIVKRVDRLETWVQRVRTGTPITGGRVADDTLSASLMKKGQQAYQSDIVFTAGAYSGGQWPVSWSAGNVAFADGTSWPVLAGSTALAAAGDVRYVYALQGNANLQVTSLYSDVLGDDRVFLAILVAPPVGENPTSQRAMVHLVKGLGEAVHSGAISANAILASHIQAGAVTTAKLDAGAVTTDKLAAGSVTASKISVAQLDAISADMGTLTAGTVRGATIETGLGNPKVIMDSMGIRGLDGVGATQFEGRSSDGKFTAGGGAVVLDESGLELKSDVLATPLKLTWGANGAYVYTDPNGNLILAPKFGGGAGVVEPASTSDDLGSVSYPWWAVYLGRLRLPGAVKEIDPHEDVASVVEFVTEDIARTTSVDHAFRPSTTPVTDAGWGKLGDSTKWWFEVRATNFYKRLGGAWVALQKHDDVALIEGMKAKEVRQNDKDSRERVVEVFDPATIPDLIKDETGEFVDLSAAVSLALGAVRQLAARVGALEAKLGKG